MKLHSIRRRLIAYLVGLGALLWIVAVLATTYYFRNLTLQQADSYLEQYAALSQYSFRLIRLQNPVERDEDIKRLREQKKSLNALRVQSFQKRNITPAANLWFASMTPVAVGDKSPIFPTPVEPGYVTTQLEEGGKSSSWRILYTYNTEDDYWLAVAVDLENMEYFGVITLGQLLLPLLILMPLMLAFLVWGVNNGLKPLKALADKIHTRGPSQLDPIDNAETPREMQSVVSSLNQLLEEIRRGLENEKRFTSNAAHELKTTLAIIQTEIQRFQLLPGHSAEIKEFLTNLYLRINRASKTITQLLQLARLDASEHSESVALDLKSLINEQIVDLAEVAVDRKLEVEIHGLDDSLWIKGNLDLLGVLFRNLVLNAFTYSSFAGEVYISLSSRNGCAEVIVANACQPLGEDEFKFVATRFYRGSKSDIHGSGLGLSIVQRIAQLHHARLEFSPWREGEGFKARVCLPL